MKYLNANLIKDSFLRLRETQKGGKKGMERTSAVMCFLAFDAMLKRTGANPPIDLDPDDDIGKNNRNLLTREFSRLAQFNGKESCQVLNFGEVTLGGTSPEKRFSANFLTVPLKSATTANTSYGYPNRPKPLLSLGLKATGLQWGMDRHSDWKENLPILLQERKTNTPFHDLACFVLRQHGFISEATILEEGILDGLSEIFTPQLCEYWKTRLKLEKPYCVALNEAPFQDEDPKICADPSWAVEGKQIDKTVALKARINYLEGLLRLHHIDFDKQ